jgi:hypothetical protein
VHHAWVLGQDLAQQKGPEESRCAGEQHVFSMVAGERRERVGPGRRLIFALPTGAGYEQRTWLSALSSGLFWRRKRRSQLTDCLTPEQLTQRDLTFEYLTEPEN